MTDVPSVPAIPPVQPHNTLSNIPSCDIRVSFNWCRPVLAHLDCGAQANVVSYEYYMSMNNRPSMPLEEKFVEQLSSVSGEPLEVVGLLRVPVRLAGTALRPDVRLFVVKGLPPTCTAILGLEFILEHLHAVYWQSRTYSLKQSPNVLHRLEGRTLSFSSQNQITVSSPAQPSASLSGLDSDPAPSVAVILVRSVTVRPHASCLVNGTVSTGHPIRSQPEGSNIAHLFEPHVPDSWEEAVGTPALVSLEKEVFPILLSNHSGKYVRCKAGMVIGQLSRVAVQPPQPLKMVVHSSRIGQITMAQGADAAGPDVIQLGDNITIDLSNTIQMTAQQRQLLKEMLVRNKAVFASDPKQTPTTTLAHHRIETGSHPPVYVPPYRVSPAQRQLIDEQAQEMLDNGVIRPSKSPYSSPVLLVKKSDGKDRFCVDFRRLNLNTKKDVYPLPRVDDMLDALGKADYFSVLDLQSGFWQIPLHPDDMEKTAFSTTRGHYEFLVMAFGLCNAPATFQRAMDQLLRDLRAFCQAYMDDVITFTEGSFEKHVEKLEVVLQRLQSAPMVAKPSKFKVLQRELKFLGHIISRRTVKPDPAKTAAVHAFPMPKCVKDLQSFLGLVGYYRRFVPGLATTAYPLYRLFKKGAEWKWGPEHDAAVQALKQALTTPPLMRLPDFDRPFVLCTDASDTGLGAVLSQLDDDKVEHPVYYASRTLVNGEPNYTVTERECLAVRWACDLFRPYLLGRPFSVFTDHAALVWLARSRDTKSKLTRWVLELQEFDMTIRSRPGTENANADALSRLPALLDANQPMVHYVRLITTRSQTHSLPVSRRSRQRLDADLVLDERAYDVDEALRQSTLQLQPQAGAAASEPADEKQDDMMELDSPLEPSGEDDNNESDVEFDMDEPIDVMDTAVLNPEMKTPSSIVSLPGESIVSPRFSSFSAAQLNDPQLLPIIMYLKDSSTAAPAVTAAVRTDSRNYILAGDVLYHRWDSNKVRPRLSMQQYRTVVPRSLRIELLHQYHDGSTGGHLGEAGTYERIADKYYWPTMYADVKSYVHSCPKCGARKTTFLHRQTPLHTLPRPREPFEALGIDVLGPLPQTKRHNKYILVITDYHTRWPIALAMRNQRASTIATLLVEQVFCQHGFPATVLSDRGSNFMSELMAAVLRVFHAKKLNTTSYHPQTNGLTERFNHVLCTMLTQYTSKCQNDWDDYLPFVLLAYRTTPQKTTGQTPFYMLYGRNVRFPFDTLVPKAPLDDLELKENAAEYVDTLIEKLKVADQTVRNRLLRLDERRLANNSELPTTAPFPVDSKVWLHSPVVPKGLTRKLMSPWTGPYQVVDVYPNLVNYKLHPLDKRGQLIANAKSRLVHVSRLKPWYDPSGSAIRQTNGDAE